MSHGSKRVKSSRRQNGVVEFGSSSLRWSQHNLVTATDVFFWLTMFAVAMGLGGRLASGQLALVIGASVTALCWMLYQFTSSEPRYSWTGSEWLWVAGIFVGLIQIAPLPTPILLMLSPHLKTILPLWFENEAALFPNGWHQLSLAPWETASGLATFVSYGFMFIVASQRIRTIHDVEQTLCYVALTSVAMMVFAQLQFLSSNGKFFWSYEHPFMTTDTYPLGCFTNRNHLSQFLALGTAPAIWWLLRRFQQQQLDSATRRGLPTGMHLMMVTFLLFSLAGIALTVLMTLSRGGLLAIGLTTIIATGLMCRLGLASMRFGVALVVVFLATGGLFSMSKYESILTGRLAQNSGRSEIWAANFKVARDFPLMGTGVGTHSDAYQLHIEAHGDDGQEYTHAECGYLQIASECGLAGLVVASLMIATSFWWCLTSIRNSDMKVSSAAAVILSSLIANVLHAIGDFFWYTPSCVLLLAILLACAARLHRLTRQETGNALTGFRIPRLVSATAMCGLIPILIWMFDLKYPEAMAETHHMQGILLANLDTRELSDEEKEEIITQRIKDVLLAARLNPRDAKLQESASSAYVQLFDLKQESAENSMSVAMLRDTIKASEFESATATSEWLQRAVGANLKLLKLANRAVGRSLANGPLRSKAYIQLADLSFLVRMDNPELTQQCLNQALALRPTDPDTMYHVGSLMMQEGQVDAALAHWRKAFQQSSRMQERIAGLLAAQVTFEYFQKEFDPDWKGLGVIGRAFAKAGRTEEAEVVNRIYITDGLRRAESTSSEEELEAMVLSIRDTCAEIGDLDAAVEVLTSALKRIPHSYSLHYRLGLDLISVDRASEASEYLQWCASRHPEDKSLQELTSRAVIERLKQTPSTTYQELETDFTRQ